MERIQNMTIQENHGVPYLTFSRWDSWDWINHAFSTRLGGVSQNEFSSMNLNFGRGDKEEAVMENYRRFCQAAGFDPDKLVASAQDHHTHVRRVGAEEAGAGIWKPKDYSSVDGLITNEPGIVLVTYYADCVPLYLIDPKKKAIGLAHAGWRGTVAQMGREIVEAMRREFSSRPEDLFAAIGPSIGVCCYEVDEPVREQILAVPEVNGCECLLPAGDGKYMLDLWELNRRIFCKAGIPSEQITVGKVCTKCHKDLLFSHRVMGAKRGGMAAMLSIRETG